MGEPITIIINIATRPQMRLAGGTYIIHTEIYALIYIYHIYAYIHIYPPMYSSWLS